MRRRDFVSHAAAASLLMGSTWPVWAQGGFVEGRHYVKLSVPQPVLAPPGKIEVVEFFWYGCPHCNAFEPALEEWSKQLPSDVVLRRVPVAFRPQFKVHQRLYYALEAMGKVSALHRRVFNAIHVDHEPLDNIEALVAFASRNGLDPKAFREKLTSFTVEHNITNADLLAAGYKIDGVPALGIHGRYFTSPALAGGEGAKVEQAHSIALAVTDYLVGQIRGKQ